MTNRAVGQFNRAGRRMAGDLRTIINDGEDLLKAAVNVSDEGFTAARRKFEKNLTSAREALADASQPVIDSGREAVAVAGQYVRGNPWTMVGVAIAAGAVIGFLASKR